MWLRSLILWVFAAPALAGTTTLTWEPPTQRTDGSPLTNLASYHVYERCGSAQYARVATVPAPSAGYTRTGLPDGTTCWWRVTAVDADGVESYPSNEVSKTFAAQPLDVPGAPGSLVITWQATSTPPTGPPDMATRVGFTSNGSDASGTVLSSSGSIAVLAGDVILVFSKWEGAPTTDTITDNAAGGSNTYTKRASQDHPNGDLSAAMHSAIAKANETLTFTQTLAAARPFRRLHVLVGRPSTGEVFLYDNSAAARDFEVPQSPTTGPYSVSGDGGIAFTGFGEYAIGAWTPGAGWTEEAEVLNSFSESRLLDAEITIEGNATWGAAGHWVALSVAFKDVEPPPTGEATQEGFRFGLDDGSESAHTWDQAQDANTTTSLDAARLLRVLIDSDGDLPSTAYKLKYQKNGAGGYEDVPVGANAVIAPVIEVGDVTESGNNTATTSWAVAYPAYAAGDLLLFHVASDANVTHNWPTTGPNGETIVDLWDSYGGTAQRISAFYFIGSATTSAGTLTVTPSASEQWTAAVARVPAGEFDPTAPIQTNRGNENQTTAVANLATPTWTTDAVADGRIVVAAAIDTLTVTAAPAGWTTLIARDRGAVGILLGVRDAATTASESVASASFTKASETHSVIGYVVNGAVTANPVYLSASANIAAGGEPTTARLTPPSGKTTSDFTTGRRWDDENGNDSVDIADDLYTELEWSLILQDPAKTGDYFDFRVYAGETPLDTYAVTPRWTVATSGGSINLVTEDSQHGQTADVVTLTQAQVLASLDSQHGLVSDSVVLTQGFVLGSQDSAHAHTADSPTLSVAVSVAPGDSVHQHVSDALGLIEAAALTSQDSVHDHVVDLMALTQASLLASQDSAHTHTADEPALTQANVLDALASAHAHVSQPVVLTEAATLTSFDSIHAHASDLVGLTQSHSLSVDGSIHAHVSALVDLIQAALLGVESAAHGHAVDGATLAQATVLMPGGSVHVHTAELITLSEASLLSVVDAAHAHVADAVTVGVAGVLGIQDAVHAHVSNTASLIQAGVLVVDDSAHALMTAQVALSPEFAIEVADSIHAHTVSQPELTSAAALAVAAAAHLHAAGLVELSQSATLIVSDSIHQLISGAFSLIRPGQGFSDTLFVVQAEDRLYLVTPQSRNYIV